MPKIVYSVGKNGMNRMLDTAFIQLLVNQVLKGKSWHKPLVVDGKCGPNTVTAITNLQSQQLRFMHADGLIEPNRTTFNALIKLLPADDVNAHWNTAVKKCQPIGIITTGGREKTKKPLPEQLVKISDTHPAPSPNGYSFPLDFLPKHDYHKGGHARYFGARRSGGARLHAGCDLLAPVGSAVYAIADGIVESDPYYFYDCTFAIEVKHEKLLVRYGELLPYHHTSEILPILPAIRRKAIVRKGELIGYVGRLSSGNSMLHFEVFANTASGKLTDRNASNNYKRRSDLVDPTSLLDGLKKELPQSGEQLSKSVIESAIKIGIQYRKRHNF